MTADESINVAEKLIIALDIDDEDLKQDMRLYAIEKGEVITSEENLALAVTYFAVKQYKTYKHEHSQVTPIGSHLAEFARLNGVIR